VCHGQVAGHTRVIAGFLSTRSLHKDVIVANDARRQQFLSRLLFVPKSTSPSPSSSLMLTRLLKIQLTRISVGKHLMIDVAH
jgi:hypothetical protein